MEDDSERTIELALAKKNIDWAFGRPNNSNPRNTDAKIIVLPSDRWKEFQALRLRAAEEDQRALGVPLEDEKSRQEPFYADMLNAAAKEQDEWFVFAQDKEKVVGMAGAMCKLKHISSTRHLVTLVSVYVLPEFRKHGIGKRLIDSLVGKLEKAGHVKQAILWVTETQDEAVKLYKKCGFTECGKVDCAVIIDNKAYSQLIMQKSIKK